MSFSFQVFWHFLTDKANVKRKKSSKTDIFKFIGNFSPKDLIFFGIWYKIIRLELIITKG